MGIKVSETYAGAFANADDIEKDKPIVGHITHVRLHNFGRNGVVQEKIVIGVDQMEKEIPLGPQKASVIADAYGDDTDSWIGKGVHISRGRTPFGGRLVDCVVVEPHGKF